MLQIPLVHLLNLLATVVGLLVAAWSASLGLTAVRAAEYLGRPVPGAAYTALGLAVAMVVLTAWSFWTTFRTLRSRA